jgi:hypothetical protein
MPILRAYTVDPTLFEATARKLWTPFLDPDKITDTTFQAHPDAYRFEPQGARVHIAVAPTPEKFSSIWIPQGVQTPNGLGIIFAVGPMVLRDAPHPYGPFVEAEGQASPGDLLYRQVMIKKYGGAPLAFDAIRGDDYYDNIITLSVRDILAIDFPENRPAGAKIDGLGNMLGQQV